MVKPIELTDNGEGMKIKMDFIEGKNEEDTLKKVNEYVKNIIESDNMYLINVFVEGNNQYRIEYYDGNEVING